MEETWHAPASCQEYSQKRMSSAPSPAGCQANISSGEVWGKRFPPLQGMAAPSSEAPRPARRLPKEGGPLPPLQCANGWQRVVFFSHIHGADSPVFWGFSISTKPLQWLKDAVLQGTDGSRGSRKEHRSM